MEVATLELRSSNRNLSEGIYKRLFSESYSSETATQVEGIDEEKRTATLSFGTEKPALRWYGYEILDMTQKAMDLQRVQKKSLNLLFNHSRNQPIGRVLEAWVDESRKKAYAIVRFSRNALAEQVFQDIKDDNLSTVSFSYRYRNMVLAEDNGEIPTYRVTEYEVLELSIETVPEDPDVGVGRSVLGTDFTDIRTAFEGSKGKEKAMEPQVDMRRMREELQKEVQAIFELGRRTGFMQEAEKAIADGLSIGQFKDMVLERMEQRGKPIAQASQERELELDNKDKQSFSFARLILGLSDRSSFDKVAPFEHEVLTQYAKRNNLDFKTARKVTIPGEITTARGFGWNEGSRLSSDSGSGGKMIQKDVLLDSIIDMLQAQTFSNQVGCNFLTGLSSNLSYPKQTTDLDFQWLGPAEEAGESDAAYGEVFMSPKTIGVKTFVTTDLLVQTGQVAEKKVRELITRKMSFGLDYTLINGVKDDKTPLGILANDDIDKVELGATGGEITWDKVVEMETRVHSRDYMGASSYYLMNSLVQGKLKTTQMGENMDFIYGKDGRVNGYPAFVNNHVPANLTKGSGANLSAMVFGDFSTINIGIWSKMEIFVNPYRHDRKIFLSLYNMADFGYEYPEALSKMVDIKAGDFGGRNAPAPRNAGGNGNVRRRERES